MTEISATGRLTADNTVTFERAFDGCGAEKLWQAVATQEGLARWFMSPGEDPAAGGRFDFEGGWAGNVTVFEPGSRVVFVPDSSDEASLAFRVTTAASGSRLILTDRMGPDVSAPDILPDLPESQRYQPGGPGTHWTGFLAGYHSGLDALAAILTGEPDRDTDYNRLCEIYAVILDKRFAA